MLLFMMTCDSSHGVGDIPYSKGANGNTVNFLFYTSTYFRYSTVWIKSQEYKTAMPNFYHNTI